MKIIFYCPVLSYRIGKFIEISKRGYEISCKFSCFSALRKNLCKIENCDKNDITGATVRSRSNFLQYTTDTVICQDTSAISLMEWSEAEWNQADSRRLSRAGRDT